jgi:hypothetical protein
MVSISRDNRGYKPDKYAAQICNEAGDNIPPDSPPPAVPPDNNFGPWHPFNDRIAFDFAWDHFVESQSSEKKVNQALMHWAALLLEHNGDVPWRNAEDLYKTIDQIQCGDSPWKTYKIQYQGPRPQTPPKWMTETYELCCRDSRQVLHQQLATSDFKDKFNPVPYQQFTPAGRRVYSNLMSGDWAWHQAVQPFLYVPTANMKDFYRRRSQLTPLLMARCLFPLSQAATKLLYRSQLVIKNFTLYTCHQGISRM